MQLLKPIIVVGLVLIVLGALALACQGITHTAHEKIINLGQIQASADVKKTLPLPPLLGGLAPAGGIVMDIVGRKIS